MRKDASENMRKRFTSIVMASVLIAGFCVLPSFGAEENKQALAKKIDPALAVPVAAAIFEFREKKIDLVDVRPSADFEQYRIPGSLNIPLHAVKTKSFLKARPIVLLNEGYLVSALAQACEELNAAGFRAAILDGGLYAWQEKGGQIIGDPFAQAGLSRISPMALALERGHAHHFYVQITDEQIPKENHPVPEAIHIPLLAEQGPEQLKRIIEENSALPFFNIAVLTAEGLENDRIERRLRQAGIQRVFFLEGGLVAYVKELENAILAQQPRQQRTFTTGACPSCTDEYGP
jgi:rhodanese-related sulfurtransferase